MGFPRGSVDAAALPSDLVDLIRSAMAGDESSRSPDPVLDEAILAAGRDVEAARIESDGYSVSKERWPGGAAYATCLTHDVDNVARPRSHLRERRDRFGTLDYLAAIVGLRSLYNNIGLVASMERSRGLTSSFYLMAFNYDLGPLAPTLASLRSDGWDIGLHGDFGTHDSGERMAEAASRAWLGGVVPPEPFFLHILSSFWAV